MKQKHLFCQQNYARGPEIFSKFRLSGRQTFQTYKNRKIIKEVSIWLISMKFCYLEGKMFKNITPDLTRSGRTCPANLGVRSGNSYAKFVWALPNTKRYTSHLIFLVLGIFIFELNVNAACQRFCQLATHFCELKLITLLSILNVSRVGLN